VELGRRRIPHGSPAEGREGICPPARCVQPVTYTPLARAAPPSCGHATSHLAGQVRVWAGKSEPECAPGTRVGQFGGDDWGMGTFADAGDGLGAQGDTPYLPGPTGPWPVGVTSLWLTDASRHDPWVPRVAVRELMVSLWYPAGSSDGRLAPYMTPVESELQLTSRGIAGVPPDALSRVRTNAGVDATPVAQPGSLPLIVLSPGFTGPRSSLTGLAEDLASHGYVVAGVEHTYESFATAFPDGRVTTCLARESRRRNRMEAVAAGRAADVRFVLDKLTGAHQAWPGGALVNPARIGMAGHSVGGAATIAAMVADPRIRAGIDMDGSTVGSIPDEGLARPFLFLGKQSNYTPGRGEGVTTPQEWKLLRGAVSTWERDWELLTGWRRWLVVAGAVHASFTDLALLADQIGIDTGASLSGARSLDITRAYVRAFFDQHLRGMPQSLLDQPSARYPEVTFC
jgi:dienelactone hydrolase